MLENQGYGISFSAYEQYMRQVKRTPQLANEEEINLLLTIQSGVEVCQARDRLVEGYQPLLIGLAKRFVRRCKEMELLDLDLHPPLWSLEMRELPHHLLIDNRAHLT